ncbi:MAG: hypothetical protein PHS92_05415 [Candidatus Gracilibacteria bacterium]|nr:hypothetical protein [Candidatus Gracilibacteria bacterium]
MLSTNFESIDKDRINDLFDFVLNNDFSDFYKKKYMGQNFQNYSDYDNFCKLPFLVKNDIITTKIKDRTFVSEDQIKMYSSSSGTSKNPIPSIIPHDRFGYDGSPDFPGLDKNLTKNILFLISGTSPLLMGQLSKLDGIVPIIGNIGNLKYTAAISKEIGINGIISTSTILYNFLKELGDDFKKEDICWISLGGEYSSNLIYKAFKKEFPNAYIEFKYGNSEFHGKIGYRCDHLAKSSKPNVFHVNNDVLLEIIDEEFNTVSEGEIGDIVITSIAKRAFPLLRYKVGDVGSIRYSKCECGNDYLLEFSGRKNSDFFKIHGITFKVEAIYDSIEEFMNLFEKRCELHIFEKELNSKISYFCKMNLKILDGSEDLKNDQKWIELIEKTISRNLIVSANKTYHDLVEAGLLEDLKIDFVDKWGSRDKSINIISHIDE